LNEVNAVTPFRMQDTEFIELKVIHCFSLYNLTTVVLSLHLSQIMSYNVSTS